MGKFFKREKLSVHPAKKFLDSYDGVDLSDENKTLMDYFWKVSNTGTMKCKC